MVRSTPSFLLAVMVLLSTATADDSRQVTEIEIDVGVDEVWRAFTTTAGVKSWVAPVAEIDFKMAASCGRTTTPTENLVMKRRSKTRS